MKESVKQKILLLLGTGLVLAFSRSPRHHWRVIEDLPKAWRGIEKWDKKWRVVIFDIPEKSRMARDALRRKLKELEFRELQKSVFVHPYECKKEIDFIIEFFNLRHYVRS